jgi:hypothetical protein
MKNQYFFFLKKDISIFGFNFGKTAQTKKLKIRNKLSTVLDKF